MVRDQYRYCTGENGDCGEQNLKWHDWEVSAECDENSICSYGTCEDCQFGCESGACRCVKLVDVDATGLDDGSSWLNAFTNLQDAIDSAAIDAVSTGMCEVWVASGTYYVYDTVPSDTIVLASHVNIYGGFEGTESTRDERDWNANPTILSGHESESELLSVYHVVTNYSAIDCTFDGFTVTGGNATGAAAPRGGGWYSLGGSPIVRNCEFKENIGDWGGAIYVAYVDIPHIFDNCAFVENTATSRGGAIMSHGLLSLSKCRFIGNHADYSGGAIAVFSQLCPFGRRA